MAPNQGCCADTERSGTTDQVWVPAPLTRIVGHKRLQRSPVPTSKLVCTSAADPQRRSGHRFYFLSNEEDRIHIHVTSEDGEAKFWLEPILSLAVYHGLNPKKLSEIQLIIEAHKDEIIKAWQKHFGKR